MLIGSHPCAQLPFAIMQRTCHSQAQYHQVHFLSPQLPEGCDKIVGRDFPASAGMRVKLSDAGREYLKLFDEEHGTSYLDEGEGTVVGSGRLLYTGLCDVKWDSGNKPDVNHTYFIYNTGNDGLYHLALVDEPAWGLKKMEPLGMEPKDHERLEALRSYSRKQAEKDAA